MGVYLIMQSIVIILVIGILYLWLRSKSNIEVKEGELDEKDVSNPNYYLPYRLRETVMSNHERLLFENLRVVLGLNYDVYPQVNLDKIFRIERQSAYKYYLGWLRRINQKSVDFLIVNKGTQSPVFAIELDDSSHEEEDRIDRDKFVGELFKRNNFPLVRFNPGQYEIEELKIVLNKYLNKF
ncbi:MAG: hypothetical protein US68_C0006G0090 [Candidatus Shapirobacteria bacterium GW2011_GWE1_38_10]|uniref:DUF2726 domain-containing protein n=1 Tax=Candidatus Shapirobacteria bacterium GW2011_GWE1_38_10 TaxID=1618488 RepID=A0A0G0IHC4_9BACT|nr:MAG: hypothetical protein US46_C0002G0089 [Candidatus Shapirobacteria bacterium GW2011_GWF2_37_20]KKQ50410.1 MAG: hypothetical protein US68_C0006G0090 [Candidatus Shapirobacteria bacterium GW2011_GWE1_38_10]KKQ65234.1 MAG: hypothetical protein US85_C0001G0161 [Candidatus Shapirobacteria bacterium GW2011_GWF1_38_23]